MERREVSDDPFVYGVRTTGVYCRPSCSSRQPRRENVMFFDDGPAAERAGYRACRKCRPTGEHSSIHAAVVRACRFIEQAESPPTLAVLAAHVGLSPAHLQRAFTRMIGVSPRAYAASRRARRFRERLQSGASVTGSIYAAGFNASSRCYDGAKAELGMKPSAFKNGGRDVAIHHAMAPCDLGWVLVAATAVGVCLIEFADRRELLHDRVNAQFPAADLRGADPQMERWLRKVVDFVRRPRETLDLPLDIQGTAFQRRVWEALREIPLGSTSSYREIASRIERPKSVRAVAAACAANKLAVAIPCHRVLASDGRLTGYRWGVERKAKLLERERPALRREA